MMDPIMLWAIVPLAVIGLMLGGLAVIVIKAIFGPETGDRWLKGKPKPTWDLDVPLPDWDGD